MIGVTGADSDLGRVVLEDLLTKVTGDEIRAITRRPVLVEPYRSSRNVDIRALTGTGPAAMGAALRGVETLLLTAASDAVLEMAVEAGVRRIVHLVPAEEDAQAHPASTVLRTPRSADVVVNPGLSRVVAEGVLRGADRGRPVNWVGVVDLGVAASEALTGAGHHGRVYDLRGPLWTLPQLAATVAEVSGRRVVHREVEAAELGPDGPLHELIATGRFAGSGKDLPTLLGRPVTSLPDLVAAALAA